ncbi:hypothetical protein D3C74_440530 [compost metagenome]
MFHLQITPPASDIRIKGDSKVAIIFTEQRFSVIGEINHRLKIITAQEVLDFLHHLLVHVVLVFRRVACADKIISLMQLERCSSFVDEAEYLFLDFQVHLRLLVRNTVSSQAELLFVFRFG